MSAWRTATSRKTSWVRLATLAVALATGACTAPAPTLPGASAPAAASPPVPAARPPQPRPRPAAPAPKPADPAQTASRPPPAAAVPTVKAGPPPVVPGLTQIELVRLFGPPREMRDAAPAKVLAFRDETCALTIYLYYDTGRADFVALQYEVDGSPARGPAADACLIHLRRDDTN